MRVLPFAGISAPRLPFEKSYSAFIAFHLMPRSAASRNKPDLLATKRVDNNQDNSRATHANRHKSLLIFQIGVRLMDRQWVVKHAFGVREGHAVFLQIACGLCEVVLEAHLQNICTIYIYVKRAS